MSIATFFIEAPLQVLPLNYSRVQLTKDHNKTKSIESVADLSRRLRNEAH